MASRLEGPGLSRAQRRVNSACLSCQKRKAKCDGQVPSCHQCSKRDIECVYQQRRFRGPGKRKYIHELEQRLERVRMSLQASDGAPKEDTRVRNIEHADASDQAAKTSIAVNQPNQTPKAPEIISEEPRTYDLLQAPTEASTPGFLQLPFHSLATPQAAFISRLSHSKIHSGPFKMMRFHPRYSPMEVLPLIGNVIDDMTEMYPLLTTSHLEELIRPQPSDDPVNRSARVAILDTFLAMAFVWKTANPAYAQLSPYSWSHIKSAVSTIPLLLFQGSGTLAYEAILLMAMFMQGSGDVHLASHLGGFAVRAAQMFDAANPVDEGDEQRSSLFWTLASFDIDMSLRVGIPSAMMMNGLKRDLPSENSLAPIGKLTVPGMGRPVNIIRCRAELAKIQLQVYEQISSSPVPRDVSDKARELDQELEAWRSGLPEAIQPRDADADTNLPLPIISLHLIFYDIKIRLILATVPLRNSAAPARATIYLMQLLPTHQFTALWRILVYPISAAILLLACIIHDPAGPEVQFNLEAMRALSRLIRIFVEGYQCDLGGMLEWCLAFERTAISMSRLDDLVESQDVRQRLCQLLKLPTPQTDYLQLAQGLMGKMGAFYATQIRELADVLGLPWSPVDEFGPLVPDVLKPRTYNFVFTFGP